MTRIALAAVAVPVPAGRSHGIYISRYMARATVGGDAYTTVSQGVTMAISAFARITIPDRHLGDTFVAAGPAHSGTLPSGAERAPNAGSERPLRAGRRLEGRDSALAPRSFLHRRSAGTFCSEIVSSAKFPSRRSASSPGRLSPTAEDARRIVLSSVVPRLAEQLRRHGALDTHQSCR